MAAAQHQELFPDCHNPAGLQVINDRCLLRPQDGHRVVIVSGIILAQYAVTDGVAEAHAMISLVEQGWADQNDVARVFGYAARTLRRQQRRFDEGGLAALGRKGGYPRGRARLAAGRIQRVQQLRAAGKSYREIARLLGVSAKAIRKLLRRSGWKDPAPIQPELVLDAVKPGDPNLSAFSPKPKEAPLTSPDTDPRDRGADRLLARLGSLEDAAPLFGSATAVPRAGVLLALPVLVTSGVFECAQKIFGSLGPAFYGLRTSLLTLLLMALRNIRRRTWAGCWGWTGRPKSKRYGANWLASRPLDTQHSSARPWLGTGWPCGERPWASSIPTVTCGSIMASTPCPRPTWRGCVSRCRPLQIIGSMIVLATRCSWSPPRPTPAWSKCCPGSWPRCAHWWPATTHRGL